MKKAFSAMLLLAVLGCINSAVFAAELLDVKPVAVGSAVSIEISADLAMTYTYYTVPGQARAVIDIAEVDPEKVEPLIVVNKGAVSSISVDKAQISGIVISRIIFNLVSESNIFVAASPDRKLLTVTFGALTTAGSKPQPVPLPEPVAEVKAPAVADTPPVAVSKAEDPLGLDEPISKSAAPLPEAMAQVSAATPPAGSAVMQIPKLEPVVPVTLVPAHATTLTIKGIATGASYIEIRANQPIAGYKTTMMRNPERLVIDIAGAKTNQKPKPVFINRFGITKARIGVSPSNIRVVIDSSQTEFPAHTITNTENGLRINFK